MLDLFTKVKGSGFAPPIPGGAGGGTPATAKLFNHDGYSGYDPDYVIRYPYQGTIAQALTIDLTTSVMPYINLNAPTGQSDTTYSNVYYYFTGRNGFSKDGYVYASTGTQGSNFSVLDATNLASFDRDVNWVSLNTFSNTARTYSLVGHPTKDICWGLSVTNGTVYTIDISNPALPSVIGEVSLGLDTNTLAYDIVSTYDGEYLFVRPRGTVEALYRVELDAFNSPTNVTDLTTTGGFTMVDSTTTYVRLSYIMDPSGTPYIIASHGTQNALEIFKLDSNHNVVSVDIIGPDDVNYDDIQAVWMLPYGYTHAPTTKFMAYMYSDDDTDHRIESWNDTSLSRETFWDDSGDFTIGDVSSVDSWGPYIMMHGINASTGYVRIVEWSSLGTITNIQYRTMTWGVGMATLHKE